MIAKKIERENNYICISGTLYGPYYYYYVMEISLERKVDMKGLEKKMRTNLIFLGGEHLFAVDVYRGDVGTVLANLFYL